MKRYKEPFRPCDGVKCRTMLDEFNAVELSGAEMPPRAQDDQYMFENADDVDMDAYCSPDVDVLKMGVSVDEHSYFGDVANRLGLDDSNPDSGDNS